MNRKKRTFVNLVTVVLASSVLLLYAITQLLASAVLDNTYPLFMELPEAGGLLENRQVTYRGVAVGEVMDVTLCDDSGVTHGPECSRAESVRVEMGINRGQQIPTEVDVVVLRQSAVGEQALDIRPPLALGPETTYHEQGEVVRPTSVLLPSKPQDLLEIANRVFEPVDKDNAATVVRELADAVRGRSTDVQRILNDSAVLSEAIGDNGADYDRFFAASRIVNAALAENREALEDIIVDLANGAQLVGELRDDIDGLLDTVPPVLSATTGLLARSDANLACTFRYLANFNAYTNRPEVEANLVEALRTNTFFFSAFRVLGPVSVQGEPWLRVLLISEPEPVPDRYVPPRPIPPTLPGGACESVFGPGAGAAVQPSHQLAVPEGEVIRPENDRRTILTSAPAVGGGVATAGTTPLAVQPLVPATQTGVTGGGAVAGITAVAWLLLVAAAVLQARMRTAGPLRRRPSTALRWPWHGRGGG